MTIRQAAELVCQLEQEGIDCPNCNKKLSASDAVPQPQLCAFQGSHLCSHHDPCRSCGGSVF